MNKILSCLILLLLFSCGTRDKTSVLMNEVINSLPHEDSIHVCNLQENAAYRPSNESWKDSTSIRYYIDYPPAKDKEGNVIVDYFNDGDKMVQSAFESKARNHRRSFFKSNDKI